MLISNFQSLRENAFGDDWGQRIDKDCGRQSAASTICRDLDRPRRKIIRPRKDIHRTNCHNVCCKNRKHENCGRSTIEQMSCERRMPVEYSKAFEQVWGGTRLYLRNSPLDSRNLRHHQRNKKRAATGKKRRWIYQCFVWFYGQPWMIHIFGHLVLRHSSPLLATVMYFYACFAL